MSEDSKASTPPALPPKKKGCLFYGLVITGIVLATVLVTAACTTWWVGRQVNAAALKPVELSPAEQQAVEKKLDVVKQEVDSDGDPIRRSITITERELNGMLHRNTGLGDKVYVYLQDDGISAKANIPIEEDAPMFGGKTLRVKISCGVKLAEEQLTVKVKDVVFCGFPLPNAWLGGIKNTDLVSAYFGEDPGMKAFVSGIERFSINGEKIELVLAE